jgi:hypothetical protein
MLVYVKISAMYVTEGGVDMAAALLEEVECSPVKIGSIDNTKDDSSQPIRLGWRNCAKCNCQEFEGNQNTCANAGCGHAYVDHW